ncbi:efflux transporter outer membrane subunit [Mucilaginibacter sp. HC2]|uniref:efflux transporter outer membrane subunit n=1 Tax=Mucilaginibacter inviolabilis TaxID=2714892 RepID=UPI00140C7A32|nr:efflux transporter outer membrane subunit [Mucilaginibacter inviolabilis]NHA03446.1 efflux transporter outer membrane subunit [Mucilaginibacter inviolabilis]
MNNSKIIYLIPFLIAFAGACKVSKDVKTPQPELPAAFRNAPASDSASIARMPWKSFFQDQFLQQLIDSTLSRNYDMQIAMKNLEQSRLVLKQSKWNNVPQIGLNVTANTTNPSNNSLNGLTLGQFLGTNHLEDYSANLSLSWEADIWGKIRNTNRIALVSYLQTQEAQKTLQTALIASVSQGYFNLLMLDAQLSIARRNLSLNDSTLNIVKLQYDAGQVSLLGVQQAEAQRQVSAELVPQLEQAIAIQENALNMLAGHLPARIQRNSLLDEVSLPAMLSAGIPSEMVSRRPDVKSRELDLTIANSRVGISKAQMYPALRITASGGVNAIRASDWFNIPGSLFGIVGGSVLQPLLQRKELSTQYQIAKVEREKTVLFFRQTVLKAVGEVSDALISIEKLKNREAVAVARVKTLQQATANANALFKNGMANYLEVITAQSNALQSELELATVKRQELNAISDLYRSLGGGAN